jgi:NADH-quinone oxidoreductase subunit M
MIPILLILIPLISGLALMFLNKTISKSIAIGFSLINAVITIASAYFYYNNLNLPMLDANFNLLGINFLFTLFEDGNNLALAMVLLTNILYPIILLTSDENVKNPGVFYGLMLLIQSGLVGVFEAQDLISFYIFFEMGLVPAYFLISLWGSGENRADIAFKFFVYTLFGSLIMLVAIITLILKSGMGFHTDFGTVMATARALDHRTQLQLAGMFLLAFMIKMPMVPFHTWQPKAYSAAPTSVTMVLSGLMAKMGLYGIIRLVLTPFPLAYQSLQPYMMALAIFGVVYAAIIAIQKNNLKALLAYSSISHMALMASGVFACNLTAYEASVFQMFNHGVIVIGLLYAVELIHKQTGTYEISKLGGVAIKAPRLAVCFLIMLLASVGLPLTNGFVGEFLLLKGIFEYKHLAGLAAGVTIILGAVYMFRAYQYSMYGNTNETTENVKDISISQLMIWAPLVILVIVLGVFPNLFLNLMF